MRTGKIVGAVFGGLLAILAIGVLVGGAALMWAYGTQRDADGFLTSPTFELETSGYALTSEEIDLAGHAGDWWPSGLADVRIEAEAADTAVFLGIGPSDDVAAYLAGVAHDEVTTLGPRASDVEYDPVAGSAVLASEPATQPFWVVSTEGVDAGLTWEVEQGEWTVVAMNADASPGISMSLVAGARIGILLAAAIGLLIAGLVLGSIAAGLLVWATRRAPDEMAPVAAVPIEGYGHYPVAVTGQLDPGLSRWMWLVKWLLAIPHFIILFFLWVAFVLLSIVAFFSILFTGRYPRGIFDFNVGVLRWNWRVDYYAVSALGTDQYPPFTLADADYPARLDVAYPEQLSRGLVLVKWWLLAIPHYLIVGLFTSGLIWWTTDFGEGDMILEAGGGLIGLLVIIAVIALAFTGRYPQGLFDLVMGLNRWAYRVVVYAGLMRDEYPPFRLDLGGSEPGTGQDRGPQDPGGGTIHPEPELTRT